MLWRVAQGHAIREIRLSQGIKLRQISAEVHISLGHLSEIETGKKEPSSEFLDLISKALGVTMAQVATRAVKQLERNV